MESLSPIDGVQINAVLLAFLADSSSRAGRRLVPERRLSELFGVPRHQIRVAIDMLVERQILLRKHGSGVYVRKVPDYPSALSKEAKLWRERVTEDSVFVKEKPQSRLKPDQKGSRLRMALWWQARVMGASAKLMRRGALQQAEELGHELIIHDFKADCKEAKIASLIGSDSDLQNCDGHMVLVRLAATFIKLERSSRTPSVFLWPGMCSEELQPLIRIDTDTALSRALRELKAAGHRKVGLVAIDNEEDMPDDYIEHTRSRIEPLFWRLASANGLEGAQPVFCRAEPESVQNAFERLLRSSSSIDAMVVSDDVVLKIGMEVCAELRNRIGVDFGVIAFSNKCTPLPAGFDWSRMEFNPQQLGRLAVQCLVQTIQSAGSDMLSFSHQPLWLPGQTHIRRKKKEAV